MLSYSVTYVLSLYHVKLGDFNGDGVLDIVASAYGTGNIFELQGAGNGTFTQAYTYAQSYNAKAVVVGDFNSDGVQDFIAAAGMSQVFLTNTKQGVGPLLPFSLSTIADARQALPVFDKKLQQLAAQRGQIGSFQSRVQVGINNLQSAVENFASAEGRIRDADIAQESANLVRLQILQQAASSILGQANLQPQLALTLLKGGGSK